MIQYGKPAVILAPMEGVTDAPMRWLLSEVGGFSFCVTEFFRISQNVPHVRAFDKHVPELRTGAKTPGGLPVQVQLLGGNPEKLALAAQRACEAGAWGIDLNFGCPAPTVNRHDGGATLLKQPKRIRDVIETVRRALPAHLPVSAKLRLGWECAQDVHVNADMAAEGGANWITIHARTKAQGYRPPVEWQPIGEVRRRLGVPVVANGDIWTFEDFLRCREMTGCEHFMLGRGALADPTLATRIQQSLGSRELSSNRIEHNVEWRTLIRRFAEITATFSTNPNYPLCRVKQWLRLVNGRSALPGIDAIKSASTLDHVYAALAGNPAPTLANPNQLI